MMTLYPVILSVPQKDRCLWGRERVQRLSRLARHALKLSAQKKGVQLPTLPKSPEGAPLPVDGVFWSIAHKPDYVAGVVSKVPVGIDIERIKPCTAGLFRRVAADDEWQLAATVSDTLFFRYWTAKEAVLKSFGVGLKDLSQCHVLQILNDSHLMLEYQHHRIRVEHFYFKDHIAAIVAHASIHWTVNDEEDAAPFMEYPDEIV